LAITTWSQHHCRMQKKITLLIDNILTPYEVARYNAINEVLEGKLLVWFQAASDINRHWSNLPDIHFKYEILPGKPFRLIGKDVHTFHINPGITKKLQTLQNNLEKIIICGWDSSTYWLAAAFCKVHGIPYTLWSGSTKYEASWRRTLFFPIIYLLVRSAQDYIAYGSRAKAFLQSLGVRDDKIKIFYNSVDLAYFSKNSQLSEAQKKQKKVSLDIPVDNFVFLFIGQLIERKGVRELLEAFKILNRQNNKVSLLVVGNGKLRDAVIQKRVRHISHVEYDKVPQLYGLADCLVLPSHEEVWGLVINEAMAAGLPVISSDVVGASEDLVIEDKTGYVYRPGDIAELGKCMSKMLKNAKQLGAEAAKLITKTDPATMAKKHFGASKYGK